MARSERSAAAMTRLARPTAPPFHTQLWRAPPPHAGLHIVAVIAGGLALDAVFGWAGQIAASLWTAAVFAWLYRRGGRAERQVLVACMAIATFGECLLSLGWGLYDYQFGNVPFFVPPGHALLMTLGLLTMRRLPRRAVWLVPALAAPWALAGLAGGWDSSGIVMWALLVLCMALSRGRPLYATMFVLSLVMELYGTWLGNWAWHHQVPATSLTTTNPPVHAGAFYCALDLLVLLWLRWRRSAATTGAEAPAGGAVPLAAGQAVR